MKAYKVLTSTIAYSVKGERATVYYDTMESFDTRDQADRRSAEYNRGFYEMARVEHENNMTPEIRFAFSVVNAEDILEVYA